MEDDASVEISIQNNTTEEEDDTPIEENAFSGANIERRSTAKGIPKFIGPNADLRTSEMSMSIQNATSRILNVDNISPVIRALKYTAFGIMERHAEKLEATLNDDDDYEFEQVLRVTDDDSHAQGQKPITFLRRVLASVCYPSLLADNSFPEDVKERAKSVLRGCKGLSIGSATEPAGIEIIRRHVAKYITIRDDVHSNWQDVVLTAGSSEAIRGIMKLIACDINGQRAGIMLPVPTKKIYRVFAQNLNFYPIGYYLDEESNWSIEINELNRAYNEARKQCYPRAIIVINPGNPTGQVLTRENIEEVIKFACEKELLIFADEVHQIDIHIDEVEFISFKKVLKEMGFPYNKMELASFMSASAGHIGECGLRGGYVEFVNVLPDVKEIYLRYISTKKCPPVLGQVAIEVLVNPPSPGEPSYNEYRNEMNNILKLHRTQAAMVQIAFNTFTNFSCTTIMAGRNAFPTLHMPDTALLAAEEAKQSPDLYFASLLLEDKGICISPGTEFGQKENTYHLCFALVLAPDDLNLMLGRFKRFNQSFSEKFLCKCRRKKAPED